jgi:hypothetical protein
MLVSAGAIWPQSLGFFRAESWKRELPALYTELATLGGPAKRRLAHPTAPAVLSATAYCATAAARAAIEALYVSTRRGERAFTFWSPEHAANLVARFTAPPGIVQRATAWDVSVQMDLDDGGVVSVAAPFSGAAAFPETVPPARRPASSRSRGAGAALVGGRALVAAAPRLLGGGAPDAIDVVWRLSWAEKVALEAFWRGPAARGARWLAVPGWLTQLGVPAGARCRFSGPLSIAAEAPFWAVSAMLETDVGPA